MIVEWLFSENKNTTTIPYGIMIIFTAFTGGYIIEDFIRIIYCIFYA